MHDSTARSFIGSEYGSSSYCSSEAEFEYGLPSAFTSCVGNNTLYFTDRLFNDSEMLTVPPYDSGAKEYIIDLMFLESGSQAVGLKLSDARMAARRAEEAATRRQQAAHWLQTLVGSLPLPSEPSEEDLRLCLKNGVILCNVINEIQPGTVSKVVDGPIISNQLDGDQSAHQYFENVRNFLVAVEDMGLPSFEASDLEEGPMFPNSLTKLVDCILALKSYHDWKQGGALGFWRLKSPSNSTGSCVTTSKYLSCSNKVNVCSNHSRRKWTVLSDQESLDGTSLSSSPEQSANSQNFDKESRASFEGVLRMDQSGQNENVGNNDDISSSLENSVSTSTWLQDIRHKFREVLEVTERPTEDAPTSTFISTGGYGGGAIMSFDHNTPSQSLLSLVSAIIGDKPAEEVPTLVEFMLRKIMEEFERHLLTQRNQVTEMKSALKDIMVREEKLASQNMVLEALTADTQEEIKMERKLVEEDRRMKEEDRLLKQSDEKRMALQVSKNELDYIKHLDEEHLLQLEHQKKAIEMESKERLSTLELQLKESLKKIQEMEHHSTKRMISAGNKDAKLQKHLLKQLAECKDLRWSQLDAKEEALRMQFQWKQHVSTLEEQLQVVVTAASGYHKVLAENRQLYNEVQDLKGNIRVYCRVRPFLIEIPGRQTTIDYVGENGELILSNPCRPAGKDSRRSFTFNKCFGPNSLQEEVFLDTQPLIRSVLDGFNVCIFAYGQTGSGKTYTMSGPNNMTPTTWGVNYRALNDLFNITQSRVHFFQYEIGVQMLEIYNEHVRDLLAMDGVHKKLEIRNNSQLNGLNVPDATIMPVRSPDDVLELMRIGQRNRAVGATSLNERSSRSHSVLTVHVQGTDFESGDIFRGSLHLVDLAGSERVDKSEVTGDRLKEAQHINKSLSALGDVIAALAQKNGHVPYRNSKLTQLLQDSLGGQAKTLMFVHISPDVESFGESISTLKFAERVALVELGAARSNKESGEIQNLKEQVCQLKDVVVRKDSEINCLQMLKERLEKGESPAGAEKSKFKLPNSTKSARRLSSEASAAQKSHKTTMENGSVNARTRQSMRRTQGRMLPSALVLSTSHDPEDPAEHMESSSACSPLESPSEHKVQFEVSKEGAINVFEKLKLLKSRRHWIGKNIGCFRSHNLLENNDVKAKPWTEHQEAGFEHHGVLRMHDSENVPNVFDTTTISSFRQPERNTCKKSNGTFQPSGDDTVSSLNQDYQQTITENGPYMAGAKGFEAEYGCSTHSIQHGLETMGGGIVADETQGLASKRSSFLLNDLVLDENFGGEDAFHSRDICQDDSASFYSESGVSAEADTPTFGYVEANKILTSSSRRPHRERKDMVQNHVLRPQATSTPKFLPLRVDRKSTGGLTQTRTRRHLSAGSAALVDKPSAKRNVPLTGNSNEEVEPTSSRRSGFTSLTTWR